MKLCYGWLKELVDFDWDAEELAHRLTMSGTECNVTGPLFPDFTGVTVGKVVSCEPVESSDKLFLCEVDTGSSAMTSICGAPNVRPGLKVAFAGPGAELPGGIKVEIAERMGHKSEGMICSESELGLSEDHSGVLELENTVKVGSNLREALDLDDWLIEFDLTPNRPDCLSSIGIAREIAVLAGTKVCHPSIELNEISDLAENAVEIDIEDPELCPRYMGRVIRNVKIGRTPWWMKKYLYSTGVRSINNIVDITNFVLMEYGHPLHAFDYDLFSAPRVLVRSAKSGEKFKTLDDVERTLEEGMIMITDSKKNVALGGIMGGLESEVTEKSSNVLLESAYFHPTAIRRTSKKLGIQSESQVRFEKGADPECVPRACDRAASLIQEYAGGKVLTGQVDCYPKEIHPVKISLRPGRVNEILDTDISAPEMIDILTALEFTVQPGKELGVAVPTFRPDVTREIDLVEEVARIYGVDKIKSSESAAGSLVTTERPEERFYRVLRALLVSQGMVEALTNTMIDPARDKAVSGLDNHIKVLNPVSVELSVLRQNFLHSFLHIIAYNLNRKKSDISFFEIGKVFIPKDGDPRPYEPTKLAIAFCGEEADLRWDRAPEKYDFFNLKGVLEILADDLGLGSLKLTLKDYRFFETGKSFDIRLGEAACGFCGVVSKMALDAYDIELPVYFAELDLDLLIGNFSEERVVRAVPRYPSSVRDIAVIVDEAILARQLSEVIEEHGGDILESISLFDVYAGKQVPAGKKSLAFSIEYRSREKTLTDEEIDRVHNSIVKALGDKYGAELRT